MEVFRSSIVITLNQRSACVNRVKITWMRNELSLEHLALQKHDVDGVVNVQRRI